MVHFSSGIRATAGSSRALWFFLSVIIGITTGSVHSFSQEADAESKLRERMTSFWQAMVKADYIGATQFVLPSSRDVFSYKVPRSPLGEWKIQKLEFNENKTACKTVTIVNKPMALFGAKIDWPMHHDWVLEQGQWYLNIPRESSDTTLIGLFKSEREVAAQTRSLQEVPKPDGERLSRMMGVAQRLMPDPGNPRELHFGEKAIFRYSYRNDAGASFRIVSVHSDCHCTGAKQDYPEIGPGQTGTLEITLDTFGLPLGSIEKEVLVQFSDLPEPVILRLSLPNLPNFTLTPAAVDFGNMEQGKPAEKSLRIANDSGRIIRFLQPLASDPKLEVSMNKTSLAPREEMIVTLRYMPGSPGELLGSLMLRCDLEAEPLISIRISGIIGP